MMAISESTRCTETSGKSDASEMSSTSSQAHASFPGKTQASDGPTTSGELVNDSSAAAKFNASATSDVNPARNAAFTEDTRSPVAAMTADRTDHAANLSFSTQVLASSDTYLTGDSFSWSGQAPEGIAPQSGLNNGANIAVALSVSATAGVSPPSDSFSWSGQAIDSAVHPGRSNNGANVSVTLNASATAGAYSLISDALSGDRFRPGAPGDGGQASGCAQQQSPDRAFGISSNLSSSGGQAPDDSPDGLLAADNRQGGVAIAVIHLGLNLLAFDSGQGGTSIAALDFGLDALAANSGQGGMPLAALSLTLNAIAVDSELDNNLLEQSFQSVLSEISQGGTSDATIRLPDNHAMTIILLQSDSQGGTVNLLV